MRPHFVEVKFYIHITTEPQLRGGGTNAPCEISLEMLKEAVDIISSDSLPSLSDLHVFCSRNNGENCQNQTLLTGKLLKITVLLKKNR